MIKYNLTENQITQLIIADFLEPLDIKSKIIVIKRNKKKEVTIKDFLESCSY